LVNYFRKIRSKAEKEVFALFNLMSYLGHKLVKQGYGLYSKGHGNLINQILKSMFNLIK